MDQSTANDSGISIAAKSPPVDANANASSAATPNATISNPSQDQPRDQQSSAHPLSNTIDAQGTPPLVSESEPESQREPAGDTGVAPTSDSTKQNELAEGSSQQAPSEDRRVEQRLSDPLANTIPAIQSGGMSTQGNDHQANLPPVTLPPISHLTGEAVYLRPTSQNLYDGGLSAAYPTPPALSTHSASSAHSDPSAPSAHSANSANSPHYSPQHGGGDQLTDADADIEPASPPLGRRPESLLMSPLTHPNGQSMFPTLSTSEQEDIAREALTQAEASIVAESFDADRYADDASDGGYDSDGFSSASTSAESSVRDYLYENGRRYHRFREGSYNFPNDDVEQEREDMKHAMVKLLCTQHLHFAPIGNNPQEILDIGTGTGIWTIEMGDQYPSAQVMGIDLSPIQPDWLPPNVRFLVDDVESPWLHPRNHFDYIHSRHTVMAIRDWMRLFRRSLEHLKPGGWMELQEIHHSPLSAHPSGLVSPEHPVAQFWDRVTAGLGELGVDLNTASGGRLISMMQEAGFINVTERVFHVPIGTWPKNKVLKTVGLYWRTILLDGIQAIALGPLTRGLHWNREQVEVFLMNVRRGYYDNHELMYMPLHIVFGQKPLHMI